MKKFPLVLTTILIMTLTLFHASSALNLAGKNVYTSYVKSCSQTATFKESTIFDIPTQITVEGSDCSESNNGGSEYIAQIWDHLFWLL